MIEPGYTLNERYQLKQTLGEGGMANVYLAHDLILDRDVAVKVLRLDLQNDPDAARRFQREAMATSELVHPNIVSIYDVGEAHGQQYLVMEYVPGSDLKKYIVEHFPIPYQRVIEIMGQILSAVEVAHDHHIIHRDLKPQNILIDRDGNAKISDFGIAVALSDNSMTQTNSLLGSVHYLSPEQARGGMPTRQSDIYALGIILFEMLTGTVPFEGDSAVSIALKHFQEAMPSVRQFDPRIPQALENVVLKATAKDPNNRYSSADAMSADLKTALSPARAHEEKFVPNAEDDLDETKVLPVINQAKAKAPETKTEAKAEPEKPTPKKKSRFGWLKTRWPFIAAAVAVALIVIGVVVALSGGNHDVTVPDLRGMSQAQAQSALESANLKLGDVTKAHSSSVDKNRIISSDPTQKAEVASDSTVDIVLSSGPKRFTLDDYTGETYSDVAKDLRKKGFTVHQVKESSTSVAKGEILDQDVDAGKKVVPSNTTIIFTVSKGDSSANNTPSTPPDPESSSQSQPETSSSETSSSQVDEETSSGLSVPAVTGQDEAAASAALQAAGLGVSSQQQASDSVAKGQVISQSPAAGSSANHGDSVTIVVSTGPAASESSSSVSSSSSSQE
ncbi:Stk1 family PASTA domain-containing Ser/Thr kinase [Lacticaseibacillus manihotivorans]|jgi:serine/threonine-protein kinase|uniref:non-specific serine/threonine protein kinase n=2 Tax=Lacticaseibacillus manihotivorans TaxID=88233 RepID=A0A0R1R902_9LACO|nr:Stk1 family PASTA domain-containing Ser/Thr kinase [Lacticaseibacillus manihotivorans]KRL53193.1 hypothetical protein FD01_GL001296 [Lacticaseibacillus manihotivorans DSM 13343 = JCM 12514]QFQ91214.1 Stk1 family PASTA domain-containing Ser/Thr kinase [Lacticaseibacillus manihotivorans]